VKKMSPRGGWTLVKLGFGIADVDHRLKVGKLDLPQCEKVVFDVCHSLANFRIAAYFGRMFEFGLPRPHSANQDIYGIP